MDKFNPEPENQHKPEEKDNRIVFTIDYLKKELSDNLATLLGNNKKIKGVQNLQIKNGGQKNSIEISAKIIATADFGLTILVGNDKNGSASVLDSTVTAGFLVKSVIKNEVTPLLPKLIPSIQEYLKTKVRSGVEVESMSVENDALVLHIKPAESTTSPETEVPEPLTNEDGGLQDLTDENSVQTNPEPVPDKNNEDKTEQTEPVPTPEIKTEKSAEEKGQYIAELVKNFNTLLEQETIDIKGAEEILESLKKEGAVSEAKVLKKNLNTKTQKSEKARASQQEEKERGERVKNLIQTATALIQQETVDDNEVEKILRELQSNGAESEANNLRQQLQEKMLKLSQERAKEYNRQEAIKNILPKFEIAVKKQEKFNEEVLETQKQLTDVNKTIEEKDGLHDKLIKLKENLAAIQVDVSTLFDSLVKSGAEDEATALLDRMEEEREQKKQEEEKRQKEEEEDRQKQEAELARIKLIEEQEQIFRIHKDEYISLLEQIEQAEKELVALEEEIPLEDDQKVNPWDREDITGEERNNLIQKEIDRLTDQSKTIQNSLYEKGVHVETLKDDWLGLGLGSIFNRKAIKKINTEREALRKKKEEIDASRVRIELVAIALDEKEKPFLYYAAKKVTDPNLSERMKAYGVIDLRWTEKQTDGYGKYKFLQDTGENEGFFEFNTLGFRMIIKNVDEVRTFDEFGERTGINPESPNVVYKITGPDGTVIVDNIKGHLEARRILEQAVHDSRQKLEKEFNALNA